MSETKPYKGVTEPKTKTQFSINYQNSPDDSTLMLCNKHYNVPHDSTELFTGRRDILKALRESCLPPTDGSEVRNQKRFVLHGVGGSGKTETCIKFAQDYRERFWGVFWVDASSIATVLQGFRDIAQLCGINHELHIVRRWLSNIKEHWLLVMDNADVPSMDLSTIFPPGKNGSILIVTRNASHKIHTTVGSYHFGALELKEAVILFLKAAIPDDSPSKATRNHAVAIVKSLKCLALPITQAGAYIRQTSCTMEEYRTMYSSQQEGLKRQLSDTNSSIGWENAVFAASEVSIRAIEQFSGQIRNDALKIFRMLCFWHYNDIPMQILQRCWRSTKHHEHHFQDKGRRFTRFRRKRTKSDSINIQEAASLLASFSLLKIDKLGRLSMHPLVQRWFRDRLSKNLQRHSWKIAVNILANATTRKDEPSGNNFSIHTLVPHIETCIRLCKDSPFVCSSSSHDRLEIASKLASALHEIGRFWSAMELREKLLEARRTTLGLKQPETLQAMLDLADSYSSIGHMHGRALELRAVVLKTRQKTLGNNHPDTIRSMNYLAHSYSCLGHTQLAMELREQALCASQKTLGRNHADSLIAMGELAKSYSCLRWKHDQATKLNETLYKAACTKLGKEHPITLRAMRNLVYSYDCSGCTPEIAISSKSKLVQASQKMLGNEHRDTLQAMHSLANSYGDMEGRKQEGLHLKERVLEAMNRTLGFHHPDTLLVMHSLANSYCDLGWEEDATLKMRETVLESRNRVLGTGHLDTLRAMHSLANSYSCIQHRWDDALRLREEVLEGMRTKLGAEHPDTLRAMHNLANSYSDAGIKRKETLQMRKKVLESMQKTPGVPDCDISAAIYELANSYSDPERQQEILDRNREPRSQNLRQGSGQAMIVPIRI